MAQLHLNTTFRLQVDYRKLLETQYFNKMIQGRK